MSTPHIKAEKGDFAKTVLMPGDPLRSKFVAETYLTDPVLVNNVRGVQGYTGTWNGTRVSVMASGMGIPSIGIYSWELYKFFGVENIIRIGSAGGISDSVKVLDIVAAQAISTNSSYLSGFELPGTYAPMGDFTLLTKAVEESKKIGVDLKVGNILSSDNFYYPEGHSHMDYWKEMGILATEMESVSLYANAAYFGKRALVLCTVSDHLYTGESLTSDERRVGLRQMIEIALGVAAGMENK